MSKNVFKRKLYARMLAWKQEERGATALLIQGARRVGKSTIAEEFARNEYRSYVRIDFSNVSPELNQLFDNLSNLDVFFFKLQALVGVSLYKRESVIVFDEVQLQPKARQAIKHLVADGRYDYIETGSLISIRQNVKDIVIPSEEYSVCLHPLDYEEFRWALGDSVTMDLLRTALQERMPLGDAVNRKMMQDFRLYMVVGGMPQAVDEYISSNDLIRVDRVKRRILELYTADFMKIDGTGRTSLLFNAIPAELNRNAGRYVTSNVIEGLRPSRAMDTIAEMADSMTVNVAYHANDPNVGFVMHKDVTRYKLYLCDTGLFVTLAFRDREFADNTLYQKLLVDKLSADLGYVYENVVAQMLRAAGHELFYYSFPTEKGNHNYEVDFLVSHKNKISPVEVKSSGYRTHASLDAFMSKFSARVGGGYLVYTKDLRREGGLLCLPVYMVGLMGG